MRLAIWLTACLALAGCRENVAYLDPLPDDGSFARGEPTAAESERCRLAADYSRAHDGLSLLMIRGGEVICEEQQNGNLEPTPHHLFSGTKTFSCALAAALAAEGLDLDAPASQSLTEWTADARKAAITPRHLLHFVSGLGQSQLNLTIDGLKATGEQRIADKYAYAVAMEAEHDAGSFYEYGSSHLMAFGAFVQRRTGRDPLELLEEKVLKPIGLRYSSWNRDPAGHPALPYGAWTTAREWAKFGVLLRDGGRWKGRQVLDEARLAECFRGSVPMPGYGLGIWLNQTVPADKLDVAESPFDEPDVEGGRLLYHQGPDDLVAAAGFNDQRLYIVPSRGLVIVRLGNGGGSWRDGDFLSRALDGVAR